MTTRGKIVIRRFNRFLSTPVSVLIVLVLMFGYFAIADIRNQAADHILLQNSSTTVNQLKRVLCEKIPDKECNLSKAVLDIKGDNAAQTILLCKLFLTDSHQLDSSDLAQVEAICNEQIRAFGSQLGSSSTTTAAPSSSFQPSSSSSVLPSNSNGAPKSSETQQAANGPPAAADTLQVTSPLPVACVRVQPVFTIC